MTKLTLDDIADLREYERERETFREQVIALKKRRRIALGPFVTLLFENRDTIRFQIQEMARVEKLVTDESIQEELDIYNPMIPDPGQLCATMFIELTSEAELREWLPKLVGVERSVRLRIGDDVVKARPEDAHEAQLTREDVTASVHYVWFDLSPEQAKALGTAAVTVEVAHPAYEHASTLLPDTVAELVEDAAG